MPGYQPQNPTATTEFNWRGEGEEEGEGGKREAQTSSAIIRPRKSEGSHLIRQVTRKPVM